MVLVDASQISPFEIIKSDGYTTVKLNGILQLDSAKAFDAEIPKLLEAPFHHIVVNCENLSELSQPWVRCLVKLGQSLKSVNTKMRLIFLKAELKQYLKNQGVDSMLQQSATLRSALIEFGLATPRQLDVNFINPFLTATMDVLRVQAKVNSKPGQVYKRGSKDKFLGDISGVIGLVSEAFVGSVVISFPESTFLKIVSKMLNEEYTRISAEIEDGAGEITNMVFGQAKSALNQKGYGIRTAIPSVVTGKDHSVQQMTRGPRVAMPFESDAGPFFIEICLSE